MFLKTMVDKCYYQVSGRKLSTRILPRFLTAQSVDCRPVERSTCEDFALSWCAVSFTREAEALPHLLGAEGRVRACDVLASRTVQDYPCIIALHQRRQLSTASLLSSLHLHLSFVIRCKNRESILTLICKNPQSHMIRTEAT